MHNPMNHEEEITMTTNTAQALFESFRTKWPHFYGEDALNGWDGVVRAVHEAGGKIMPQLWHVGMARKEGTGTHPEAPRPPTQLGFDGIELHGAHGYLIDQFFWAVTNVRTDAYGGDLVKRTRFAAEIIAACRRAVGPDFPIMLRFSQWKADAYDAQLTTTPDELARFLAPLVDAGADLFHCSTRRFWEPAFDDGSGLNLAGWTKKLTGKPTVTVGSIGLDLEFTRFFKERKGAGTAGIEELLERLARGEFDLVAVGRALLNDPEWAVKIREGRGDELRAFELEATQRLY
ncbi:unnamed protein product [Rhizoctonia solani]|nr:unnamed protein product [Rhizoctonia solani]